MKRRSDEEISAPLYEYDAAVRAQYGCFAGVDEAGRGPLCGPVCVAACILDPENPVQGINDSKKLTEKKRDELYEIITGRAVSWSAAFAIVEEIEEYNILNATFMAMNRAIAKLDPAPELALIDGNRNSGIEVPSRTIIRGDGLCASIAAASIIAKVTRDRYMYELDLKYPQYHFAEHKGYGTALHYAALREYGPSPEHRPSFLRKMH